MKCEEALLLMNSILDGEADAEEEQLLRFHLNGCVSCRKSMLLSSAISSEVADLDEPDPPEDILRAVQARIASGDYDRSPLRGSTRSFPLWKAAAVIPFAAAALLLLHGGSETESPRLADHPVMTSEESVSYTPAPVMAYSRPSSVTTF